MVLFINIIELEVEEGYYAGGEQFANELLLFSVDKSEYIGEKVLAVPRCCQLKKGTMDQRLINASVMEKDKRMANSPDGLRFGPCQ